MLPSYQRYVVYSVIQRPGKAKPDKVPVHPETGKAHDGQDVAIQMTATEAWAVKCAKGFDGIGLAIVRDDPYAFLDADDCFAAPYDANRSILDQLKPVQREFVRPFIESGAAWEVSRSLSGIHVLFVINDKQKIADLSKAWALQGGEKFEFYREKRFCAFGAIGWTGNPDVDLSGLIDRYAAEKLIPLSTTVEALAPLNFNGPILGYTGPEDDDELIARMRGSKGSANAGFGKTAHPRDLFDKNIAVLSEIYPLAEGSSTGEGFNHNAADLALMSALAYWTGCDALRMDRLFRRSALMRRKYEQRPESYVLPMVQKAISSCTKVYDLPRTDSSIASQSGTLFPHQMEAWFEGCTYISSANRVFDKSTGQLYPPPVFNAMKGGKRFYVDWDGPSNITTSAFTAFTENRIHKFPKVQGTVFRPAHAPGTIITIGDETFVNTFKPPVVRLVKGDPSPFVNHLRKMLATERDVQILLSWMAMAIRPEFYGRKILWSPVVQGVEGSGKTPIMMVLEYGVGEQYYHVPNAQDLGNKFNAYIDRKLLIAVDEVQTDDKREMLETLKPLITNPRAEVQNKGQDKRMADNPTNWIFFSNYRNAIPTNIDSRRYAVMFSRLQRKRDLLAAGMDSVYFRELFQWLKADGCAIVVNYLINDFVIPAEFAEAINAPATSSHKQAILESDGPIESAIREAQEENLRGFKGKYLSTVVLKDLLRALKAGGEITKIPAPRKIGEIIERMGFESLGRVKSNIFEENNKRPYVYFYSGEDDKPPVDWEDDYKMQQGYQLSMLRAVN